jgi:apolipoprotein N-acyltransferase
VVLLPPAARFAAALLRTFARAALLWMAAMIVFGDGSSATNTFAQIRRFVALFLAPEAAAWCLLRAFAARATVEHGVLLLARGRQRLQLALRDIAGVQPWRVPLPGPGVSLRLASGGHWRHGVGVADPGAFLGALQAAGGVSLQEPAASRASIFLRARLAVRRGRLGHPVAKFVVLPLLLAIPAFRLHQHIAYGSAFGELQAFGGIAYLKGFALWWAAWAIGVLMAAAVLRALVEAIAFLGVLARPAAAAQIRGWLERLALAALYLGLPGWLLLRLLSP